MQKITFIVNGIHGPNKLIREILLILQKNDLFQYSFHLTQKAGEASQIAHHACANHTDIIVAAGGDGTINEVVNGMMLFDGQLPRIAIIPIGTGNDFMRNRKQFSNPQSFLDALIKTQNTSLDLGCIQSTKIKHYFLNIADTGFGGTTVHTLNRQRKYLRGKISYSFAILRTFLWFKKPELKITGNSFEHIGKTFMVAFCNSSTFGSGLTIAPSAKPDDGILNITIIGNVSLFDYLRYLPSLRKGHNIQHPEVNYYCDNSIRVDVIKGKADTEADGETITTESIHITLIPSAIRLIEPIE